MRPDVQEEQPALLEVQKISIKNIEPNPQQPRLEFSHQEIEALSKSLVKHGFLQPLLVTTKDGKNFTLVAGERRWRAAQLAGFEEIPVIIHPQLPEDQLLEQALVENLQRESLNPIEEALAYQKLTEKFRFSQEDCALLAGKNRASISHLLRLLHLPENIQKDVAEGLISLSHAKILAGLKNSSTIQHLAKAIKKQDLSVRKLEQLCQKGEQQQCVDEKNEKKSEPNLDYITNIIRQRFQTRVRATGSAKKGKIEIYFFSPAEFERITNLLQQGHWDQSHFS